MSTVKKDIMKSIEELKLQPSIFLHNFSNKADVFKRFEICPSKHKDINILFASYGIDNYSGEAFVLFELDNKLFEVNGNHCSCMGLENQWEPEETTIEALAHRLVTGAMGIDDWSGNEFSAELKEFLGIISKTSMTYVE